jgi:hypothetical protein
MKRKQLFQFQKNIAYRSKSSLLLTTDDVEGPAFSSKISQAKGKGFRSLRRIDL